MTGKQRRVLDFIADFIAAKSYSPSLGEIAAGVGLRSIATVQKHIESLLKQGRLSRRAGISRSLEVAFVRPSDCPSCGRMRAEIRELTAEIVRLRKLVS